MDITLTAVFEKSPYGYIGYVEELPGANTQGIPWKKQKRAWSRPFNSFLKQTDSLQKKKFLKEKQSERLLE